MMFFVRLQEVCISQNIRRKNKEINSNNNNKKQAKNVKTSFKNVCGIVIKNMHHIYNIYYNQQQRQ